MRTEILHGRASWDDLRLKTVPKLRLGARMRFLFAAVEKIGASSITSSIGSRLT